MPALVTLKWSDGGYGTTRAEAVYQVSGVTTLYDALTAPGIPATNSSHPQNSKLKAEPPFVRQGFNLFDVQVVWSIPDGGGDHPNPGDNPTAEPVQIEWSTGINSEEVGYSIKGDAIVNSAGDPFDPGPTRQVITWYLTISRNEDFYDQAKAFSFQNKINSNEWTVTQPNGKTITFHPGSVMVTSILPTGRYSVNATFVNVAYRFELREYPTWRQNNKSVAESPFQLWIRDEGARAWYENAAPPASDLQIGAFVDGNGDPLSRPIRLDGKGKPVVSIKVTPSKKDPISRGAPIGQVTVSSPPGGDGTKTYTLIYPNYEGADFSQLGL